MRIKRHAFTLVEAVIVLAIVAVIFAVTSPVMKKRRQAAAERQFLTHLRLCWDLETNKARVHHQQIVIKKRGQQMIVGDKVISIPKTLSANSGFGDLYVGDNGFTAPQTRALFSSIDRAVYIFKIQMGWGGYRVEKEYERSSSGSLYYGKCCNCGRPGPYGNWVARDV